MNRLLPLSFLLTFCVAVVPQELNAQAQSQSTDKSQEQQALDERSRFNNAKHPDMQLHEGTGDVASSEYVIVDLTGSVTRSPCPYTCEDRGLSEENCRAWQSGQDPKECYERDLRIPSNAFPHLAKDDTGEAEKQVSQKGQENDEYVRARANDSGSVTSQQNAQQQSESAQKGQTSEQAQDVIYQKQVALSDGEMSELVKDSAKALANAISASDSNVPTASLNKAQCIAVFPGVTKAALIIGAQHGDGVVTCRGPEDTWSRVAFLDLTGGSFGLQLGAKSTDLIMLFMSDNAKEQLSKGRFTLGTDASVAFGSKDKEVAVDSDFADVQLYASSTGLFAGASLHGTRVSADEDELREFYEENATYERTLTMYDVPNYPLIVRDFIQLMPKESANES